MPTSGVTTTCPARARAVSESAGNGSRVGTKPSSIRSSVRSSTAVRMEPNGANVAWRASASWSAGRSGTLRLMTVRASARPQPVDDRSGQPAGHVPVAGLVLPGVQADGHGGAPEVGRGQRRADGARVQRRPARVEPRVDAGGHQVGGIPERTQAGGDDAQRRGAVQLDGLDPVQAGQRHRPVPEERAVTQVADGGTAAGPVTLGRDDDHVVAGVDQRGRQRRQSRGVETVVVGDQDPHDPSSVDSSGGGSVAPAASAGSVDHVAGLGRTRPRRGGGAGRSPCARAASR